MRAQLGRARRRARRRRARRAVARRGSAASSWAPSRGSGAIAGRSCGRSSRAGIRGTRRAGGCPARAARRWRISSNCCCACICWVNSVAWMPWNRPSSQPTSWACAIRSSASLGVSLVNGSVTSASSLRRSSERMPSSSCTERSWISFSDRRPASSSGASRASSRRARTIEAMRMSLVGRATCSPSGLPSLPGRRRLQRVEHFGGHRPTPAVRARRRRWALGIDRRSRRCAGYRDCVGVAPIRHSEVEPHSHVWMMIRRSSVISRTAHCGPSRVLPLSRLPPYGCWSARNVGTSFTSTPP